MVREVEIADGDVLDVAQQSNSSTRRVLSRTGTITYEEPKADGALPPEDGQP